MNCFDGQGNMAERYQRLFTRPLGKECSIVDRTTLTVPSSTPSGSSGNSSSGSNSTLPGNSTGNGTVSLPGNSTDNSTGPIIGNNSTSNGTSLPSDNSTLPIGSGSNGTEGNVTIQPFPFPIDTSNVTLGNGTEGNVTILPVPFPIVDNSTMVDNSTSSGNETVSVGNETSGNSTLGNGTSSVPPVVLPPVVGGNNIQCCDYFEKGAGYEFSVCDGIGAIIRPELIGGDRDIAWALMQPESLDLSPVWSELTNLVNNYCDSRSESMLAASNATNGTNSTSSNATLPSIWSSIDLPWTQWKNETLESIEDIVLWLGRYQQYLTVVTQYTNEAGIDSVLNVVEQGLANVDSDLNFTGVTYGQLVTDYNTIYTQFVGWYNQFFGPEGLINGEKMTIQDGQTTVYEWSVQVPSMNFSDVLAIEQPAYNALPAQFENIAEWITTKFSGIILENACNICNGQSPPVVNSTNSTNGTNPSNETNSTIPVGNDTNSTLPVGNETNGTIPGGVPSNETNSTLPVGNETNSTGSNGTFFSSENYTLPENCTLLADNETVSCNNGVESGEYTFTALNEFWNTQLQALATKLENVDNSCANVDTCFQNQTFVWFASVNSAAAYIWLFFDAASRALVYTECQNIDSSFQVPEVNFETMFSHSLSQ